MGKESLLDRKENDGGGQSHMGTSFGCFPGVRPGDGDPPLPGPAAAVKGVEVEAECWCGGTVNDPAFWRPCGACDKRPKPGQIL
ncbi:unnamed protein product [Arctogadus glacialis]